MLHKMKQKKNNCFYLILYIFSKNTNKLFKIIREAHEVTNYS